jgi:hypothetical protein
MRGHHVLRALLCLFATTLGCVSLSGEPACPPEVAREHFVPVPIDGVVPSCAEAKLGPVELHERAVTAAKGGDFELSYRYLALIHIQYPASPQDREAFALAARVFRKNYYRHRTEVGSVWVDREPQFLFGWLAQFYRGRDAYPKDQMNAMFVGMNYGIFREFLAYAKTQASENPGLSRFEFSVEKDNGIIESIEAVSSHEPSV